MLPQAPDSWTLAEAAHLLNRAGFGGSPADVIALHALGRTKAVDSLLQPGEAIGAIPLPAWATSDQVAADFRERAAQRALVQAAIKTMGPEEAEGYRKEAFKEAQRIDRQRMVEGRGWWFRKMLRTKAPLREKMTLFWHDHFATSQQKVREPGLLLLQNELFRRHATGDFRALTHAILWDPAMMLYLDTQSSKRGRPNENFAREVMELFTLGEGHYTEQDIREAARAFTGYEFRRIDASTRHNKRQWDEGEKTVFGKTGRFTGDDVIDLIFEKPEAARLMACKLWEYFAAEDPPPAAVDALADTLRRANFQVAPLLREIFLSKQFYSDAVVRNQIKCPIQFLVQLLKQLELDEAPRAYTQFSQEQLGQVLFQPPNVAGWDWGKAWINTNTLLTRYNLAGYLTKGSLKTPGTETAPPMASQDEVEMDGAPMTPDAAPPPQPPPPEKAKGDRAKKMLNAMELAARFWKGPDYEKIAPRSLRKRPADLVDSLGFRFFQSELPDKHRKRFIAFAEEKQGVVFTNHEVAELAHLMLSTPDYQLV